MKEKIHLIHPFLLALSPAVFLWSQNFGEVPLREVFPVLFFLLLLYVVAWFFWKIFFSDLQKRAIITSFSLVIVLLFNYVYNIFFDNTVLHLRFRWSFIVIFLILISFIYFLKKSKIDFSHLNKIISIAAGVFILISLAQVSYGYYGIYTSNNKNLYLDTKNNEEVTELRDIYYIILDGYSSSNVIKNVLGFEEIENFTFFLENNGFYIADESLSNYPETLLSLPSSLNMLYLDEPNADRKHFSMAENHKVKDILKSYGYKYIHLGADAFTYFNRYADRNINIGFFSPYQSLMWHNTIFKPIQDITGARIERLAEKFGFLDTRKTQWQREKYKLEKLSELPEEKGPIFAFAHFLLPKGINVFDKDGRYLTEKEAKQNGSIKGYLNQVQYINTGIEKVVNDILRKSDNEPIIIIQGDHGFPFYDNLDIIDNFADPARARELVVPGKYSFPILNAYYFPDGGDSLLYDSMTPVNTFRILFNHYFEQDLELLEDISYTVDSDDETEFIVWDK
ncbi:hypothetical protein COV42_03080 [Candidatus Campbellbacteria bacterium CG11_big_fil_rev_8_21_14_0_20_44_21]|uniref:Sulfatase N-terminal domain-containing protein n=1 Tax=Candidatus Campbellbacteria bacterium CG22_combo_CG10-13_8_21_14_all_43_18 TaxID=1974530 RepID=A0A2H0DY90_9BACT|nr:MAG: hypothetical protein COW82_01335 [Candidatus Campbellbacteria bacterium CG22_combo_CG10-13_8_21_14_all_43_18]PIR24033.1 MAG: hypothetical protein COV42_03080 [Candidatus Campbellbacteria bacterium CG11_big_fil_rev_8_21_14_0_20_44_21]